MKKTTLLLTALLLLGYSAQAQWRAGVFGGAVWNHYSIDTHYMADLKYRGQWGPSAGIAGQYNFADWLGVRAELNMTAKNYRQLRTFESLSGTDYVTASNYLQLPVMASFSFGGSFVRGFLNLGGYGAWWCSSHLKGKYTNVTSDQVTDVDEDFVFDSTRDNRTEWGLAGGVGVEWRFLSHWAVQAEARCYYGLTSTQKDYMIIQDPRYNTTIGLQAGVFYIF